MDLDSWVDRAQGARDETSTVVKDGADRGGFGSVLRGEGIFGTKGGQLVFVGPTKKRKRKESINRSTDEALILLGSVRASVSPQRLAQLRTAAAATAARSSIMHVV